LPEIDEIELLEVQMINQIAPTILASKLFELMASNHRNVTNSPSYIINVTSHEGQFDTYHKTDDHVHTNVSKAAMNMLTRSGASHYAKNGILMLSVDTGWISSSVETHTLPPLTCEDGAARILDPIMTQSRNYGILLKNYQQVDW
jgi:NAD(P)-dependent dehydrogenase (short-subunit alcohol dehydrogenase family)